jgi:hypothetical protein
MDQNVNYGGTVESLANNLGERGLNPVEEINAPNSGTPIIPTIVPALARYAH